MISTFAFLSAYGSGKPTNFDLGKEEVDVKPFAQRALAAPGFAEDSAAATVPAAAALPSLLEEKVDPAAARESRAVTLKQKVYQRWPEHFWKKELETRVKDLDKLYISLWKVSSKEPEVYEGGCAVLWDVAQDMSIPSERRFQAQNALHNLLSKKPLQDMTVQKLLQLTALHNSEAAWAKDKMDKMRVEELIFFAHLGSTYAQKKVEEHLKLSAVQLKLKKEADVKKQRDELIQKCKVHLYGSFLYKQYKELTSQGWREDQIGVYLKTAAELGDMKAQFYLAFSYEKKNDFAEVAYWCKKAAEQGLAAAQHNLGVSYENGKGVEVDLHQAAYWYQKAAEQGLAAAQYNLGGSYENGQGVEVDLHQAAYWYQKAAEQGHANAQFNLGVYYNEGRGIEADLHQALKWFQKAAEQGHARAQHNLGRCYLNGLGVEVDLKQAAYWYKKAAEQGLAMTQFDLGTYYENGQGVEVDLHQAAYWYQKAAEQGIAAAQYHLGRYYNLGLGVGVDLQQAAYWYQKAAEQGHANAQFNLGVCYKNGKGVGVDLHQALKWFQKAAQQGFALGLYGCGFTEEQSFEGHAPDLTKALQYYLEAAQKKYGPAMVKIAVRLLERIGLEGKREDYEQVLFWLKKAQESGEMIATDYLVFIQKQDAGSADATEEDDAQVAVEEAQVEALLEKTNKVPELSVNFESAPSMKMPFGDEDRDAVSFSVTNRDREEGTAAAGALLGTEKIENETMIQGVKEEEPSLSGSEEEKAGSAEDQFRSGAWEKPVNNAKYLREQLKRAGKALKQAKLERVDLTLKPENQAIVEDIVGKSMQVASKIFGTTKIKALGQKLKELFQDPFFHGKVMVLPTSEKLKVVLASDEKMIMADMHKQHSKKYDGLPFYFMEKLREIIQVFVR
jgi:TPR repeat protein